MEHVLWCIGHDLQIPDIVKAEGCYLYDSSGRKYVDLESGTWCVSLGHCNSSINAALKNQADSIIQTGYCYSHTVVEEASVEILDIADIHDGKCVFLSSGSEAVEFGVQVIRKITGKPKLLTLSDSFLSSYGSSGSRNSDEWHLFDWTVCNDCPRSKTCSPDCDRLACIPFDSIGGFVFEPGSSSGMVRFPPKSLIQILVSVTRQHGGYIQINEITTGLGRTGKWFGFQHYDIKSDIVSMGKGLGNGYPISAVALSPVIISSLQDISFRYSQSHQNDPLGCAVARELITCMKRYDTVELSREMGDYLKSRLSQLKEKHQIMEEVRGRGLMTAVEFRKNIGNEVIATIRSQLLQRGYILAMRPRLNVFRIDPPLIISKDDIDGFLKCFDQILSKIDAGCTKETPDSALRQV